MDTHKQQHFAVALDSLGQVLAEIVITTTLAGYNQFACWLKELGESVVVGMEGAGSYGAGLCEFLQAEGIEVFEVEQPKRRERRDGKSDRIDALLAAKKVLTRDGLSTPRGSGKRLTLQMLLVGHRSIISERSRLYNQLQALRVSAPYALRERIGQVKGGAKLADRITGMRTRPTASPQENTTLQVLRDIANRVRALTTDRAHLAARCKARRGAVSQDICIDRSDSLRPVLPFTVSSFRVCGRNQPACAVRVRSSPRATIRRGSIPVFITALNPNPSGQS